MREILFRAKTEPNAKNSMTGKIIKKPKWIYGYIDLGYMHDCKTALISDEKGTNVYKCQYETVGQYTGLTDKNGTKIFEGDIVKHHRTLWGADNTDIGIIKWHQETCRFYRTSKFDTVHIVEIWEDTATEYEVIGNIHDNPELLESEVQGE